MRTLDGNFHSRCGFCHSTANQTIKACESRGLFLWLNVMAGFKLDIKSDIHKLTKHLSDVQRKVIPRVTVRSLNKTGVTVNKLAVKAVRDETKLPAKRIKAKLQLVKARRGEYVWSLKGLRGTTNIIEWVPASKRVPGAYRKKQGARSRAWGKARTYPGTFIGKGKNSGKMLVFVRDSRKASGVRDVHGPSVRQAFIRALEGLKPVASRRFNQVFEHELNFALSKLK